MLAIVVLIPSILLEIAISCTRPLNGIIAPHDFNYYLPVLVGLASGLIYTTKKENGTCISNMMLNAAVSIITAILGKILGQVVYIVIFGIVLNGKPII